jgi:hypothetical protein
MLEDLAAKTVDSFLRLQRILPIETRDFRSKKHNEELCPQLQHQLEAVLNATGQFEPVVYDTQCFRDDGIDVAIRIKKRGCSERELVGFQIKSYDDFRGKGLFRTLKAQRDDALRKAEGLIAYYILLCTDELEDKETIRNIESEFKSADKTIVIEPTYCLGFLRLNARRIEGLVTRLQNANDYVFRRALDMVTLDSPTAGILTLYLAARECESAGRLTVSSLRSQGCLAELYEAALESRRSASDRLQQTIQEEDENELRERIRLKKGPSQQALARMSEAFFDDFESALSYDLQLMESRFINTDPLSDAMTVCRDELLPVVAVLTDAHVRYGLAGDELFRYGVELFGVAE